MLSVKREIPVRTLLGFCSPPKEIQDTSMDQMQISKQKNDKEEEEEAIRHSKEEVSPIRQKSKSKTD